MTYGKFVYMTALDTIMFGEFIEEKDGCFYSNNGYEEQIYYYKGTTRREWFDECKYDYQCEKCPLEECALKDDDECAGLRCEECKRKVCVYDEVGYWEQKENSIINVP
jgi:hypothetical protein